ncbi:MAG: SDR family NAD(P)-dependent oxidoreductase, partial [Gammaproteobacteria bacterium]
MPSILITGCSSGIGRRCAERCREQGWRVFATARSPADVEILGKDGFETFALDLESSKSIRTATAELKIRLGEKALDAVFHNGAYGMAG